MSMSLLILINKIIYYRLNNQGNNNSINQQNINDFINAQNISHQQQLFVSQIEFNIKCIL